MSPPGGPQVYKRSTDAGRSWSKLQTLLDPIKMFPPSQCPTDSASVRSENTSCVFWDPTPIVDRQKGAVFLLTTRSWAHDGMTGFASRENSYMDMWAVKSTDVGRVSTHPTPPPRARVHPKVPRSTCALTSVALPQTWSEPKNITSQVWNAQQHTPALNNGHGIQTSTGRLIAPACARPDAVIPAMHMKEHSAIVYSDDHVRSHPPPPKPPPPPLNISVFLKQHSLQGGPKKSGISKTMAITPLKSIRKGKSWCVSENSALMLQDRHQTVQN